MKRVQSMPMLLTKNHSDNLGDKSFSYDNLSDVSNLTRPPRSPRHTERKIIVTNEECPVRNHHPDVTPDLFEVSKTKNGCIQT